MAAFFTLTEASNANSQAFSLHQFHLILQRNSVSLQNAGC
jgi:hypothetical protein